MRAQKDIQLVLLLGCTGKTGFHIANRLLSDEGLSVRVLVRQKTKLQSLFRERELAFESIIEGDITDEATLRQAFLPSSHFGPVKIVVSCLGATVGSEVEKVEYRSQVLLIEKAKEVEVSKFILVSSALMERPYNFIAYMLNCMVTNVMYWKALAENTFRLSGLDYVIVRPPRLLGGYEEPQDDNKEKYELLQNDTVKGRIHRYTVGKIVYDTLRKPEIVKTTFECNGSLVADAGVKWEELKQDNADSIARVRPNSFLRMKKIYHGIIVLTIVGLLNLAFFL